MTVQTANWFNEENELEVNPEEKETPDPQSEKPEEKPEDGAEEKEKAPAEEVKQIEEEIPFHKHPRFKAVIEEKNELKKELEEFRQQFNQFKTEKQAEEPTTIPNWFVKLYGDDPEVWKEYQVQRNFEKDEMRKEVLSELEPKLKQIEQEEKNKKIDLEIEQSLSALEQEGYKFDRNALMKVVADNKLFDDTGNFNFKVGLALMQTSKQPDKKLEAKKEVAGMAGVSRNAGDTPKKDYQTAEDLRNKDWRSFFNKL